MTDPRLEPHPVTLLWEERFSALVAEVYGRPYRFQQQGDMRGQDTIYRFMLPEQPGDAETPEFDAWLAASPPDVSDWKETMRWEREFYPDIDDVVNDLHQRGLLDAGDYAIHVWW